MAASTFHVPADVAHECLQSVPIVKDDATTILEGLEAWWEFQSTLSWLKNPPSTYPFPGVDLMGGLESIRHGVENGTIDGEYKFQSAIQDLIFRAADAHFQYPMDLLRVFSFVREQAGPVVAISDDGHSLPLTFYMLRKARVSHWHPHTLNQLQMIWIKTVLVLHGVLLQSRPWTGNPPSITSLSFYHILAILTMMLHGTSSSMRLQVILQQEEMMEVSLKVSAAASISAQT